MSLRRATYGQLLGVADCAGVSNEREREMLAAFIRKGSLGSGRMEPNSRLLTDTYTSPLRAQHGAAKRERQAAEEFS